MRSNDSPDCVFCGIATGVDQAVREVYRDEQIVAFFPDQPATLGHTLVIPRHHVADIWQIEPGLAGRIAELTVHLAAAIRRAVKPDGLNVIQSNGQVATQTVMHFHAHLVPRWQGDPLGRIWPPETSYTDREKEEAWGRLRAECSDLAMRRQQRELPAQD